jgi:large subunit ribosomal protein L27
MAKTKSAGGTRLGRDSLPKYLGIKLFEGQIAKTGQILIRQRGTKFVAGKNVKRGGDDTLYSMKEGTVHFSKKTKKGFNRSTKIVNVVNVLPR